MLQSFAAKFTIITLLATGLLSMTPKPSTSLICEFGTDYAITNSTDRTDIMKVIFDGGCDYQDEDNIAPSGFQTGAVGFATGVDITIKFATAPETGSIDIYNGTTYLITISVIPSQLIYTYTASSPSSGLFLYYHY